TLAHERTRGPSRIPVVFQIRTPPAGSVFSCHRLPSECTKTTMTRSAPGYLSAAEFGFCSLQPRHKFGIRSALALRHRLFEQLDPAFERTLNVLAVLEVRLKFRHLRPFRCQLRLRFAQF